MARRPGQRSSDQRKSANGANALGATQVLWTNKQGHASKAEQKARYDARDRAQSARPEPVDQDHPKRDGGYEECGNTGGNGLFCPRNGAISNAEEQAADDEGGTPLSKRGLLTGGQAHHRIKRKPHGEVTNTRQQVGRNGLDTHANGEIGRSPEDIDRRKGEQHEGAIALERRYSGG